MRTAQLRPQAPQPHAHAHHVVDGRGGLEPQQRLHQPLPLPRQARAPLPRRHAVERARGAAQRAHHRIPRPRRVGHRGGPQQRRRAAGRRVERPDRPQRNVGDVRVAVQLAGGVREAGHLLPDAAGRDDQHQRVVDVLRTSHHMARQRGGGGGSHVVVVVGSHTVSRAGGRTGREGRGASGRGQASGTRHPGGGGGGGRRAGGRVSRW